MMRFSCRRVSLCPRGSSGVDQRSNRSLSLAISAVDTATSPKETSRSTSGPPTSTSASCILLHRDR